MKSKVIVVANQKGGVGKSTVACNTAVAFAIDGYKTLIIDTDPQESSLNFRALRENDDIQAVSITKPTVHKDILKFSHQIIVVDAGGRDTATFRSAIMSSVNGILIIPVLPSVYDIWATQDTLDIVEEARTYTNIKAYILINQVIKSNIVKEALDTLFDLTKKHNIEILNSKLHSRVSYRNSIKEGKGVIEYNDPKAKNEMENLYTEIKQILEV
ncbi:MAG: AAA family ATPase [Candidatus Micrarchaeaceae archaeon]|nr:AAA family ATPase [Candidatus Parvarchaeum tengchongense]